MRQRLLLVAAMLVMAVATAGIFATPTAEARPGTDAASLGDFPSLPDFVPTGGVSLLTRGADSVSLQINATHLTPGDAVTVWWVIFNNPAACVDGCSGAQLGDAAINGSVIWATYAIVGAGGQAMFNATLAEGDISGDQPFGLPGDGDGLVDASAAEIHVVVRTHGVALNGDDLEAQLTMFDGGCLINTCTDLQFAVHLP